MSPQVMGDAVPANPPSPLMVRLAPRTKKLQPIEIISAGLLPVGRNSRQAYAHIHAERRPGVFGCACFSYLDWQPGPCRYFVER
jgi:hypothetical protein